MNAIPEISIGLVVTILLAFFAVKAIFEEISKSDKPRSPIGIDPNVWDEIIHKRMGGKWIGIFESVFFFCMFRAEIYTGIAGWFAFKVAAKWESWGNIVKFPEKLEGSEFDQVDFLRARSQLGAWVMTKFVFGSLLNLFAGFLGYLSSLLANEWLYGI